MGSEQHTETPDAIGNDATTRSQKIADHDNNGGIRSEDRNEGLQSHLLPIRLDDVYN